jgi:hypothetical protein
MDLRNQTSLRNRHRRRNEYEALNNSDAWHDAYHDAWVAESRDNISTETANRMIAVTTEDTESATTDGTNSSSSSSSETSGSDDSDDNIATIPDDVTYTPAAPCEPIAGGSALTAKEAVALVAMLDPGACLGVHVSERLARRVLRKVAAGGAALDTSEARYREDPQRSEDPRGRELTTQEIGVLIDISEGREPTSSAAVVASALGKTNKIHFKSEGEYAPKHAPKHVPEKAAEENWTWRGWLFGEKEAQPKPVEPKLVEPERRCSVM